MGLEYIGSIILGVVEIHDNACHNGPTSRISESVGVGTIVHEGSMLSDKG
jgi:hypothetical protein